MELARHRRGTPARCARAYPGHRAEGRARWLSSLSQARRRCYSDPGRSDAPRHRPRSDRADTPACRAAPPRAIARPALRARSGEASVMPSTRSSVSSVPPTGALHRPPRGHQRRSGRRRASAHRYGARGIRGRADARCRPERLLLLRAWPRGLRRAEDRRGAFSRLTAPRPGHRSGGAEGRRPPFAPADAGTSRLAAPCCSATSPRPRRSGAGRAPFPSRGDPRGPLSAPQRSAGPGCSSRCSCIRSRIALIAGTAIEHRAVRARLTGRGEGESQVANASPLRLLTHPSRPRRAGGGRYLEALRREPRRSISALRHSVGLVLGRH